MANNTNEAKLQRLAKDTRNLMQELADGMEEFNLTLTEAVDLMKTINKAAKGTAPKA